MRENNVNPRDKPRLFVLCVRYLGVLGVLGG
jgi:hypothetical protein